MPLERGFAASSGSSTRAIESEPCRADRHAFAPRGEIESFDCAAPAPPAIAALLQTRFRPLDAYTGKR
jgi:hypothetical protein